MKKYNPFLVMCVTALSIFTLSCSKDDSKDNPTLPDTPIQFEGSISRSIDHDGYLRIDYWFFLKNNENGNVDVNDAIVTVNGIRIYHEMPSFSNGDYALSSLPAEYYVPGKDYTVVLQYQGKTYTETLKAPGEWSANEGITTISWQYPATTVPPFENSRNTTIDVSYLFGSATFTSASVPIGNVISPFNVPATAYPSKDATYQIVASAQNFHQGFDKLVGYNCRFWIDDKRIWRIAK